MKTIVDDTVFVIGLSELFRQRMKIHEVATLLPLAQSACKILNLSPQPVPVEGYYTESAELERFFQLIRTLQGAQSRDEEPDPVPTAITQLRAVLHSPAMGRIENNDRLLSRATSPFGEALQIESAWSIGTLTLQARQLVRTDDAGLLAVAAAAGSPIGLCVARESMALMAETELAETQQAEFDWSVSEHVMAVANRFARALEKATGIKLPEPDATHAHIYGEAARQADLTCRCILVGTRPDKPMPHYHWYIDSQNGVPEVKDFWSNAIWTTASLRSLPAKERPAKGAQIKAPRLHDPADKKTSWVAEAINEVHAPQGWLKRIFRR